MLTNLATTNRALHILYTRSSLNKCDWNTRYARCKLSINGRWHCLTLAQWLNMQNLPQILSNFYTFLNSYERGTRDYSVSSSSFHVFRYFLARQTFGWKRIQAKVLIMNKNCQINRTLHVAKIIKFAQPYSCMKVIYRQVWLRNRIAYPFT